jgi:predicted ATPase
VRRGFTRDASAGASSRFGCEQLCDELNRFAYKARRGNALRRLLIARPPMPRGVYMYWGGVGRGKSFLMDCFFNAVPLTRKTRLHFHEFMREVHRELDPSCRVR